MLRPPSTSSRTYSSAYPRPFHAPTLDLQSHPFGHSHSSAYPRQMTQLPMLPTLGLSLHPPSTSSRLCLPSTADSATYATYPRPFLALLPPPAPSTPAYVTTPDGLALRCLGPLEILPPARRGRGKFWHPRRDSENLHSRRTTTCAWRLRVAAGPHVPHCCWRARARARLTAVARNPPSPTAACASGLYSVYVPAPGHIVPCPSGPRPLYRAEYVLYVTPAYCLPLRYRACRPLAFGARTRRAQRHLCPGPFCLPSTSRRTYSAACPRQMTRQHAPPTLGLSITLGLSMHPPTTFGRTHPSAYPRSTARLHRLPTLGLSLHPPTTSSRAHSSAYPRRMT